MSTRGQPEPQGQPQPSGQPRLLQLPRQLVLASAGSGKTFRISSELIRLLALGQAPDEIFASTFTRKAAGEILTRVLLRLAEAALDREQAAELAEHTGMDGVPGSAEPAFWCGVLEHTVRHLHRLNVGTLDAFFMRSTRSFALELGFPPRWTIADAAARRRLHELALGDAMAAVAPELLAEVIHAMAEGQARRSVHEKLLEDIEGLLHVQRALDPTVDDAWQSFDALAGQGRAAAAARPPLAAAIAAAEPPRTKAGSPNATWAKALAKTAGQVAEGRWKELLQETLFKAARDDVPYSRHAVPPDLRRHFQEAAALARLDLAVRYANASHAMGTFARVYETALEKRARAMGLFGFDDVTRLMGGAAPLGGRPDLHYRLDARTRHVLLDEFQDTSLAQWEALQPIADELLAGHEGERAAVIVADPKQSIYGWRGGAPELVDHIRARYEPELATLARSWRSSQVVLDTVNQVFGALGGLPIWADDSAGAEEARRWLTAFTPHEAEHAQLRGHVRMVVGPADEPRSRQRPNLCRAAAELVADLSARLPGRSIGVLTRGNAAVARIIMELRRLGVPTSEEGGTPLTDAAPVATVLALLRMADHPGNTVARYHVARTPLGAALDYTDPTDDAAARTLAHHVRHRLVVDGYGATLADVAGRVLDACDARERRRLGQLVELAFRYEDQATLRPSDFVRYVHAERVEDPTAADVRVMTVHQSKGLEFDAVVLPELDAPLTKADARRPLTYRPAPTARVTRVFPYVPRDLRTLFSELPELSAAADQAYAAALRDALSTLYVGLTRARHAVHVIVKPDGSSGRGSAKTAARILREALCGEAEAAEGAVLYEAGEADWCGASAAEAAVRAGPGVATGDADPDAAAPRARAPVAAAAPVRVALRRDPRRTRVLPRQSPSELEGGTHVDLALVLRLGTTAALSRGSVAHIWFERIGWMEDGVPAREALLACGRAAAPDMDGAELAALLERFMAWLEVPELRDRLSRSRYPGEVEVERELPFIRREADALMEGAIDRLVVIREGGRPMAAELLDFKTDDLRPGDEAALRQRVEHYRPQMAAYRRAVAEMYALEASAVRGALAFVECGVVVEL